MLISDEQCAGRHLKVIRVRTKAIKNLARNIIYSIPTSYLEEKENEHPNQPIRGIKAQTHPSNFPLLIYLSHSTKRTFNNTTSQ